MKRPLKRLGLGRHGKIFSLGLLLMYVIAASAGLVFVLTKFTATTGNMGPSVAVGDVPAALLAAYERADQKLYYLSAAAGQAVDVAVKQLYDDQTGFFTTVEGDDSSDSLVCGNYGYQLWNVQGKGCLVGDGLSSALKRITDALTPKIMELLSERTAAYPAGSFGVSYTIFAVPQQGSLLIQFAKQADLQEPIFLGLPASAPADTIAQTITTAGSTQGLLWPILGGGQTITSCFGLRPGDQEHRGVDLRNTGDVVAAADGTVIAIGDVYTNKNGGKYVWILHNGLSTRYLHLDPASITVKVGDTVKAGQVIGKPGLGLDVQPHLHFEVLLPNPPAGGTSFPVKAATQTWYAINPLCLYPAMTISQIAVKSGDAACAQEGNAAPRGWCDAYGLTPATVQAYAPGTAISSTQGRGAPATTQQPAVGPTPVQPTNTQLTPQQAAIFQQTEQNRYTYGWDQYVVAAASKYGIDQAIIYGFITRESKGDPLIVGNGDVGLMQINDGTAPRIPSLKGTFTLCGCTNTRAVVGSGCACTPDNDRRLRPEYAVDAAAWLMSDNAKSFTTYTHAEEFMLAAYNTGSGHVLAAIHATGNPDPTWDQVAAKLNGIISQKNAAGVDDYVKNVMAYAQAWNGGAPVDASHASAVAAARSAYGDFENTGTYTYDPSFVLKAPDTLTPFINLLTWADTTLMKCSSADVPGDCLLSEAAKVQPVVSRRARRMRARSTSSASTRRCGTVRRIGSMAVNARFPHRRRS